MIPNRVFKIPKRRKKKKTIHKITIAQLVKNPSAMQERSWLHSWVRKISWRRDRLSIPVFLGFPGGSVGKESACSGRRSGFDPWVGKITSSRKWQPTPVFLPGEFHGQRSLTGYSLWGHKESDFNTHTHRHPTDKSSWYFRTLLSIFF